MEFFKRLHKKYYHTDPVEHIIGQQILKLAEYDDLYENQTRFDGTIWTKFKETHKLTCQFYDDLTEIDLSNDITCLWFFRERADRSSGNDDILLKDKKTIYISVADDPILLEFYKKRGFVIIDKYVAESDYFIFEYIGNSKM